MFNKIFIKLVIITSFLLGFHESKAEKLPTVSVCTITWPPYTIVSEGKVTGSHTETVKKALHSIGYDPQIQEIPWKRCLDKVKQGQIDFSYSTSYSKEREDFLVYPKEPLEVISYVVVSLKKNNFPDWEKDLKKIPLPVGAPLGFSVAIELTSQGLKVDQGSISDAQNFDKLMKGRVKSIVIAKNVLQRLMDKQENEIYIHKEPFKKDKAYFLTVSKKFKNAEEASGKISEALKKLSKN